MDPKWVLSNEEKRIRFKNYFKKKDEQAQQPPLANEEKETTSRRKRYRGQHPYQKKTETNRMETATGTSTSSRCVYCYFD